MTIDELEAEAVQLKPEARARLAVLDAFRKEARKKNVGCHTLINDILAQHATRARA